VIGHVEQGIWMLGRLSIGWNFYESRNVKTFVVGLAVSYGDDRVIVMIGPLAFIWLL